MSWLTHWGRVTHIRVSKLTIIVSDHGLSLGRRQAIIWTNAGLLSIGPPGTNFSEVLIAICIFIQENAFENVARKLAAILSWPQYVNVAYSPQTREWTISYSGPPACKKLKFFFIIFHRTSKLRDLCPFYSINTKSLRPNDAYIRQ